MLAVTTISSAFVGGGASSAGTAVTLYAYPPPHMTTARIHSVNAAITGACTGAASDSITIKGYASSAFSTTIASGAVSASGSYQLITFTVTAANAASVRQTQANTGGVKITIPAIGNVTFPVDINIVWDGTAPTTVI